MIKVGDRMAKESRDEPCAKASELHLSKVNQSQQVVPSEIAKSLLESSKKPKVNNLLTRGTKILIEPEIRNKLPAGLGTTRMVGLPFRFSRKKGSGPQRFLFRHTDNLDIEFA